MKLPKGNPDNAKYHTTCPEARRAETHKTHNRGVWASPEWKENKGVFLSENPLCCVCGDPSQVPHHPDIEVYGKPEYLNLAGTKAYCNICHRGEHKHKFQCPVCKKLRSKSEGARCYSCLEQGDRDRIKFLREHRNRVQNQRNREAYQRAKKWKKDRGIK